MEQANRGREWQDESIDAGAFNQVCVIVRVLAHVSTHFIRAAQLNAGFPVPPAQHSGHSHTNPALTRSRLEVRVLFDFLTFTAAQYERLFGSVVWHDLFFGLKLNTGASAV